LSRSCRPNFLTLNIPAGGMEPRSGDRSIKG
jgi:hypothetical protein